MPPIKTVDMEMEEATPPEQPIEIEDEYKLALDAADVEDEALLEATWRHKVCNNKLWG